VETVALPVQSTRTSASGCETTKLSVLMDWFGDPVDTRISPYGFVRRIDQNDFVELVHRVLIHPVRIENPKIGSTTTNAFFCHTTKVSSGFEFINALTFGLAPCISLGDRPLSATSSHSHSVDHITLFRLVTKSSSLVWSCWP